MLSAAERIAREVVAPHAYAVDRDARFPVEAVDALREAGLLALPVPAAFGGPGGSLDEVLEVLRLLAGADASLGLILTMHYSQVMVLARHAETPELRAFLREVADGQLLIANSNSELSVAGTDRRSRCSLSLDADGYFRLTKDTPVISYGEYADAFLITARRSPESGPNDQVLALVRRADVALSPTGGWDAMGLRGTCSRPFHLEARVAPGMVVDDYRKVIDATGLPVTNLMFAASWIGTAEACAGKARSFVRKHHADDDQGSRLARRRLAELAIALDRLRALFQTVRHRFAAVDFSAEAGSLAFVVQLQNLKVAASQATADIALDALTLCGSVGYRNEGPWGLGREIRDALGSLLMVSNDAILDQNGELALLRKTL